VRNAIPVHLKTKLEAEACITGQAPEGKRTARRNRKTSNVTALYKLCRWSAAHLQQPRSVVRRIGMMVKSGIVCEAAGARANRAQSAATTLYEPFLNTTSRTWPCFPSEPMGLPLRRMLRPPALPTRTVAPLGRSRLWLSPC
jgi:hypothetical protein